MAKKKDEYPQFMRLSVTQSAANSTTFSQLSLGLTMFEYAGIVINKIEYTISKATLALMTADQDSIDVAVTGSNSLTSLANNQPEVYDSLNLQRQDLGAASFVGPGLLKFPWQHDFAGWPGGGMLVPAQDLYLAMGSAGLGSAGTAYIRLWFRMISLSSADYLEIVQRLRVLQTS